MNIYLLLAIIWIHCIADFFMQFDYVAETKSRSLESLLIHSVIYLAPFMFIGIEYAIINGLFHFLVDGISSKMTTYFYVKEQRHWFFVTIGVDQAVHMTCLILTIGFI